MSIVRKEVLFSIKKKLYNLSGTEAYEIAKAVGVDHDQLEPTDEESCIDHILKFMHSEDLLSSEDEGVGHLMHLNDVISKIMEKSVECPVVISDDVADSNTPPTHSHTTHSHTTPSHTTQSHTNPSTHTPPTTPAVEIEKLQLMYEEIGKKLQECKAIPTTTSGLATTTDPHRNSPDASDPVMTPTSTQGGSQPRHHSDIDPTPRQASERLVSLQDLAYLQRKEFRIHGGQVSDTTSELSYNSLCKQIDEGLREKHTEGEVIRGVLRAIKPGNFRDMLTNKDDLTVTELKSFLQSHLGEKGCTELFQDLMCAKQHENETPQQFLYRMIGLKQKIVFTAKQTNSVVKYDASTIQCIFLNTICQGIGEKYEDVRRELKPLLADPTVPDEVLLRQVIKTTTEESERKRRFGRSSSSRKVTQAHSTQAEPEEKVKGEAKVSAVSKDETIQKLSSQVEALTQAMETLKQLVTQAQAPAQRSVPTPYSNSDQPRSEKKTQRPYGCQQCVAQSNPNCNHCFVCGEEGHRAVGCLKKQKPSGNGTRSRQRDNL